MARAGGPVGAVKMAGIACAMLVLVLLNAGRPAAAAEENFCGKCNTACVKDCKSLPDGPCEEFCNVVTFGRSECRQGCLNSCSDNCFADKCVPKGCVATLCSDCTSKCRASCDKPSLDEFECFVDCSRRECPADCGADPCTSSCHGRAGHSDPDCEECESVQGRRFRQCKTCKPFEVDKCRECKAQRNATCNTQCVETNCVKPLGCLPFVS